VAGLRGLRRARRLRHDANAAYYGHAASPVDILVRHTVTNPDGRPISQMLAAMSR
jgi:hypothetical protein